ncbi:MAG: TVP38/TMEM64 family inner membrane protein YdjZ [Syntrophorhabdus sp. PtaB.Bin047]|nr:MAG: TVP38/TMEM64 family inner membrane protein YdjZ [Syntrophorhabdus sp. PtaB.Bin047]
MIRTSLVKSKTVSRILRFILALFTLLLIFLIFYSYQEGAWKEIVAYYRFFFDYKKLRLFILSFGPFAAIVFIMIQCLQVVFAPVPGEITGFVGGLIFGNTWGAILSTIGLTLGSLGAFAISRMLGLRFVEKVVKKAYIDKFNFFVTHKGLNVSFILFLIPGFPKDSLCYLLGLTRIRLIDFIIMNVFGRLPGTLMLTMQGTAVYSQQYRLFFVLLSLSIVLTFVLYLARGYLIRKIVRAVRRTRVFLGRK